MAADQISDGRGPAVVACMLEGWCVIVDSRLLSLIDGERHAAVRSTPIRL